MSAKAKLMQARLMLQNSKLSKSGKNSFAGYQYFELGDFIPRTQEIFAELGLCGVVSYGIELATLTISSYNPDTLQEYSESPVLVTSPMSSAALKGCHDVQNLGAVQSYLRRYLWVTAMEIVEHDALDSVTGSDKGEPAPKAITPNDSGKEFWANATGDEKKFLETCVLDLQTMLGFGDKEKAANYFYGLKDQEEALAVWSQLNSKERSGIKEFKPAKG